MSDLAEAVTLWSHDFEVAEVVQCETMWHATGRFGHREGDPLFYVKYGCNCPDKDRIQVRCQGHIELLLGVPEGSVLSCYGCGFVGWPGQFIRVIGPVE